MRVAFNNTTNARNYPITTSGEPEFVDSPIDPYLLRDVRRIDPFREIGVGILARPDSRETTSRLSRLFLFRRGTPPQNRSDSRGDFGVPGTRSRNDIAAIRLLRPARSGDCHGDFKSFGEFCVGTYVLQPTG